MDVLLQGDVGTDLGELRPTELLEGGRILRQSRNLAVVVEDDVGIVIVGGITLNRISQFIGDLRTLVQAGRGDVGLSVSARVGVICRLRSHARLYTPLVGIDSDLRVRIVLGSQGDIVNKDSVCFARTFKNVECSVLHCELLLDTVAEVIVGTRCAVVSRRQSERDADENTILEIVDRIDDILQ